MTSTGRNPEEPQTGAAPGRPPATDARGTRSTVDTGPMPRTAVQPGAVPRPGADPADPAQNKVSGLAVLLIALVVLAAIGGAVAAVAATHTGNRHGHAASSASATAETSSPSPTASSPGPTSSPTPTWVSRHTGDLAGFLVPVPARAKPPQGKPADEQLDLAGAAALGTDPTGWSQQLSTDDFTRAVVRRWTLDGQAYQVALLQFAEPSDAAQFVATITTAQAADPGWRRDTAAMAGPVYVSTTPTGGSVIQLALVTVDDVAVVVQASAKQSSDTAATQALLTAESGLL